MTQNTAVLVITIGNDERLYKDGLEAIRQLDDGESVEQPTTISFADETRLSEVFNERTYKLLRVIRGRQPDSIRETARLVGRDVKNVHRELTMLAQLGVIRFDDDGRSKRPVFPYDDLVISPLAHDDGDPAVTMS